MFDMVFNVDMRVCIFQHSESDPPGTLLDWMNQKHLNPEIFRVDQNQFPQSIEKYDWLVVLGGEPNVDESRKYPWLIQEKKLISSAVAQNKLILGLCLGGQLLAESLGAKVAKHPHWEIGWWDVELSPENSKLSPPNKKLKIFQWHGYSFETPPNAKLFATNSANHSQAFALNDRFFGFQFHPEANEQWVRMCSKGKFPTGKFCQTKDEVINGLSYLSDMTKWFHSLLDQMLKANT
jgi:GMP synthase-like glutamine amidotransferase